MNKPVKKYGDNLSKQIFLINELLTTARKKGIQMKRLAEILNISPSVLSAFYRTVVPSFIDNKDKMSVEEAVDYAFSLVNNISKNRFIPFLPHIILALQTLLESQEGSDELDDKRYFDNFVHTVNNSQLSIQHIEGIYRTYSISSSDFAMKIEPMIISRSHSGMIKISRFSVHGIIQEGFGMVADHQSLTIHLNEAKYPKYYPLTMQINIPICFNPKIYRGIYIAMDSSSHPIARRIVLERISQSVKISDMQEKAELIYPNDITEELQPFFNYLKDKNDILKVSVVPEPTAGLRDLKIEKKILKLLDEDLDS